jgi:hypothetical protein
MEKVASSIIILLIVTNDASHVYILILLIFQHPYFTDAQNEAPWAKVTDQSHLAQKWL